MQKLKCAECSATFTAREIGSDALLCPSCGGCLEFMPKDIRKFETMFDNHCIEAGFSDKPFLKAFTIAILGWFYAALYSLWNGTFGWWNTNVDTPFLKFYGGDMLNGPILMPLSFALLIKYYKTIPEVVSLLYNEKVITDKGITYLNNYLFSKKMITRYNIAKFSIFFITSCISSFVMILWYYDDYSGWADPNKTITIAAITLVITPITLFIMFHIGFVFDQICLGIMLAKICRTEYVSVKNYHPDNHFGLGPLKDIVSISMYIGIICCVMYAAIIATIMVSQGSIMALFENIPAATGFIFLLIFLPLVIFFPTIPIFLFISSQKKNKINDLRLTISPLVVTHIKEIDDKYEALNKTSPILFHKKTFLGYLITTLISVLPSFISTAIKFKLK